MTDAPNRVVTLADDPAADDAFKDPSDVGPHSRVARTIANIIRSGEVGGKVIGLEGRWGSGKSSIIKFIDHELPFEEGYLVHIFDAWAHQGDPLRRSFLEGLIDRLESCRWVDITPVENKKSKWQLRKLELSRRRRVDRTRTIPLPTWFGGLLAAAVPLTPVGASFLGVGLDRGVAFDLSYPINWPFALGLGIGFGLYGLFLASY